MGDSVIRLSDIEALFEGDTLPIDDAFLEALFRVMAVEVLTQALAADFGATVDPAASRGVPGGVRGDLAESGAHPRPVPRGGERLPTRWCASTPRLLALRDAAIDQLVVAPETVDSLFADPVT